MYGYIIKEGTAESTFTDIQGMECAVLAVYCNYLDREAWAFISLNNFLNWHVNESGVYSDLDIYFLVFT